MGKKHGLSWLGALAIGVLPWGGASAGILQPGVYMVSQDLGYATGDSTWIYDKQTALSSFFGGDGTNVDYYNGTTTARAGFDWGLMAEAKLTYQLDKFSATQAGYSAGVSRGGMQYLRLGFMKQLLTVSSNEGAALVTESAAGDLEVFGGVSIPLRDADKRDFFSPYEGVVKADLGLRHTYYGSFFNIESAIGGSYRKGYPTQGFAQVIAPLHWESCPVAWFRHSPLKPSLSYLHSFTGYQSTIDQGFLNEWSESGYPPIWKVKSQALITGLEFMHPFSYTFFAAIHYNRPVFVRSSLQFDEVGITLSHLF